ncbi:cytochrome b [Streptomyces indicus]|uniref:Cytochrome b561 n=1 Tax=Streptomyces indicus TaxID=417292 RepID=A0A1G8ZZ82_9ACTN|nr:cytochrome b/b6 domain-containing protein [Streptomyces indicus]SDK19645.1 cytochrome b561 [Streptomyces indicus]
MLRNGPHGYGTVTKTLHWLVFAALAVQFALGYVMDPDDSGQGRGRGRGRGAGSGHGRGRGRGGEDGYEVFGDDRLLTLHVVLGVAILVLAALRLLWRVSTPLPPWAPTLRSYERVLATWTERALHLLSFAIPATGLWLVLAGDDDAVGPHVAAHAAFFLALAVHLGLVLKHQLVDRDRLVKRML